MASTNPSTSSLFSLPNEILFSILSYFHTTSLLPLTTTSHRFASLICCILRTRMQSLNASPEHKILLELYPPSGKYFEPLLYCSYIGTPNLNDTLWECTPTDEQCVEGQSAAVKEKPYHEQLRALRGLYSRFRPGKEKAKEGPPPRHPAGDVPGSRTHPSSAVQTEKYAAEGEQGSLVKKVLHLDSHELFTQMCASVHLVKWGPRKGLFTSFVKMEEGFMRLFRRWFAENCELAEDCDGGYDADLDGDSSVSWLGMSKDVGFRFGVKEKDIRRERPVVLLLGEDPPVSYEVEYRELMLRTSTLLLKYEKSLGDTQGKAIVLEQTA